MKVYDIIVFIVNSMCCFLMLQIMSDIGYNLFTMETAFMIALFIVVGVVNFYNGAKDDTAEVK